MGKTIRTLYIICKKFASNELHIEFTSKGLYLEFACKIAKIVRSVSFSFEKRPIFTFDVHCYCIEFPYKFLSKST